MARHSVWDLWENLLLEQTKLPLIARKLILTNYFRYVDDILIVFASSHTDINTITK
jgi:hypothetical protein